MYVVNISDTCISFITKPFLFLKSCSFCDLTNKQCRYKSNIEARSRNHCCFGKAKRVTNSECVSRALVIRNAIRVFCASFHIATCGLSGCTIFLLLSYKGTIFEKKKKLLSV